MKFTGQFEFDEGQNLQLFDLFYSDNSQLDLGIPIDWGIPNWEDGSAYLSYKGLNSAQWQWQFLRRLPAYRMDWLLAPNRPSITELHHFEKMMKEHPETFGNSVLRSDWGQVKRLCDFSREKFGVNYLLNPSLIRPDLHGFFYLKHGSITRFINGRVVRGVPPGNIWHLVIDMDQPIKRQIDNAGRFLSRLQHERIESIPKSERTHRKKWLFYLRLLDAHNSCEQWEVIGAHFFPNAKSRSGSAQSAYKSAAQEQLRQIGNKSLLKSEVK